MKIASSSASSEVGLISGMSASESKQRRVFNDVIELLPCFGAIEEPRQVGKVEHDLIGVFAVTDCAVPAYAAI